MVIQGMKWLNKGSTGFESTAGAPVAPSVSVQYLHDRSESTDKIGTEHVWAIPSNLQDERCGHMFWTLKTVCDIINEKFRYITSEIPWNFKIKGW